MCLKLNDSVNFSVNFLLQTSQLKGLSPKHMHTWVLKKDVRDNFLPQNSPDIQQVVCISENDTWNANFNV